MIFHSEDEKEETRLQTSEPQFTIKDPTSTALITQPSPAAIGEEDLEVPTKKLEKYFFSPSIKLVSSPISKHLHAIHK